MFLDDLDLRWIPGTATFSHLADMRYQYGHEVFTVAEKSVTDLTTVPPLFRPFIPRTGRYTRAAALQVEVTDQSPSHWTGAAPTKSPLTSNWAAL